MPPPTDPRNHIRALEAAISAMVMRYGEPQATVPHTVTLDLSSMDLDAAMGLPITIEALTNELEPKPFLHITVTTGV